jgi:hypothetical protein
MICQHLSLTQRWQPVDGKERTLVRSLFVLPRGEQYIQKKKKHSRLKKIKKDEGSSWN